MNFLEQATERKAPPPARLGSVTKLTAASSSFANLLSAFLGPASSTEPRPRRSFDDGGAGGVRLGTVAAMSRAYLTEAEPIAIGAAARRRPPEAELSESYTHVAGVDGASGSVRKRVYFGFGDGGGGRLVEADAEASAAAADFLSRYCLCDKRLDG